jgi:hypothetical protein
MVGAVVALLRHPTYICHQSVEAEMIVRLWDLALLGLVLAVVVALDHLGFRQTATRVSWLSYYLAWVIVMLRLAFSKTTSPK